MRRRMLTPDPIRTTAQLTPSQDPDTHPRWHTIQHGPIRRDVTTSNHASLHPPLALAYHLDDADGLDGPYRAPCDSTHVLSLLTRTPSASQDDSAPEEPSIPRLASITHNDDKAPAMPLPRPFPRQRVHDALHLRALPVDAHLYPSRMPFLVRYARSLAERRRRHGRPSPIIQRETLPTGLIRGDAPRADVGRAESHEENRILCNTLRIRLGACNLGPDSPIPRAWLAPSHTSDDVDGTPPRALGGVGVEDAMHPQERNAHGPPSPLRASQWIRRPPLQCRGLTYWAQRPTFAIAASARRGLVMHTHLLRHAPPRRAVTPDHRSSSLAFVSLACGYGPARFGFLRARTLRRARARYSSITTRGVGIGNASIATLDAWVEWSHRARVAQEAGSTSMFGARERGGRLPPCTALARLERLATIPYDTRGAGGVVHRRVRQRNASRVARERVGGERNGRCVVAGGMVEGRRRDARVGRAPPKFCIRIMRPALTISCWRARHQFRATIGATAARSGTDDPMLGTVFIWNSDSDELARQVAFAFII
ncbi:hypothetical protein C8J57DRAFT_1214073 [Mycena rebaudengoi]|nr:hypothetical protein C8J57DRAFT_1214073 [Mycena rebaudengoi]